MAHTLHRPAIHMPHTAPSPADVRLHADERSHHRLDALAWICLGLGIVSFVLAGVGGSWLGVGIGVVGFFTGMVAQMISATTTERWLIVPGWCLSFLGALMNLAFM